MLVIRLKLAAEKCPRAQRVKHGHSIILDQRRSQLQDARVLLVDEMTAFRPS